MAVILYRNKQNILSYISIGEVIVLNCPVIAQPSKPTK